jgi:hypothetical protein
LSFRSGKGNDPFFVTIGLEGVAKFDGLPNPDGSRPIDVAAELHQLASTTPQRMKYSEKFDLPESVKAQMPTSKQEIEWAAQRIEKTKQQPAH